MSLLRRGASLPGYSITSISSMLSPLKESALPSLSKFHSNFAADSRHRGFHEFLDGVVYVHTNGPADRDGGCHSTACWDLSEGELHVNHASQRLNDEKKHHSPVKFPPTADRLDIVSRS